jgi:hypothetical protein
LSRELWLRVNLDSASILKKSTDGCSQWPPSLGMIDKSIQGFLMFAEVIIRGGMTGELV